MKINCNTSLNELFKNAKETLDQIEEDEEFIVKDLFTGFEWNRIDIGNRSKLGAMFFNFSKHDDKLIIVGIGKTIQNQQKYRKLHDDVEIEVDNGELKEMKLQYKSLVYNSNEKLKNLEDINKDLISKLLSKDKKTLIEEADKDTNELYIQYLESISKIE
ncbi:DUF1413 domain-containing protein [Clostridium psychrophilum]|uniref:DUF1413 domain-containing protein n=1 Tax=Clostridium psychrophilum TaxID=132926 RepID=UPI001C0DDFF9|nr:DUF1413 domain-containing protein [Clostridium psychrophilum]MBU3181672.1 single-stranded DNA-binding protein [Clostridium psychrophilum]